MRILLICLLAIFSLGACKDTKAKDTSKQSEKPYKATTVDECINEKECVWYALSKHINLSDVEYVESEEERKKNAIVEKWKSPISIHFNGKYKKEHLLQFAKNVRELEPFVIEPISISKKHNLLVFFSDDFEEDITKNYRSLFKEMFFGSDTVFNTYKSKYRQNAVCLHVMIRNYETGEIHGGVIFINPNSDKRDHCMKSQIYYALGFKSAVTDFPFSTLSMQRGDGPYSKLDLFLMYLLYKPEFTSGSDMKQAKKSFEKIYPNALIRFQKKYREVNNDK